MDASQLSQYKICFKCKRNKPLSDFYTHKRMKDGHLNKCKECTKTDVDKHRENNIEKIREYDRKRGRFLHRIKLNASRTRQYRKNNPSKWECHKKLNNAVRSGKVKKKPCAVCGATERIEAHHFDYSKPLDIIWLCSVHHKAVHNPIDYF